MPPLPRSIHNAAQMRAIDAYAIGKLGISGFELMSRAGRGAFELIRVQWPHAKHVTVLCGPGNNGGDGYIVARLALEAGLDVIVATIARADRLRGDAEQAYRAYVNAGGNVASASEIDPARTDVIVDGLFGTGLSKALEGEVAELIRRVNQSGRPVLALDIPTGLDATSGAVHGVCVCASATISFAGLKVGFFLGEGPNYVGEIRVCDLDLPPAAFGHVGEIATRIHEDEIAQLLPARKRTAHKGDHGRVLMIGGAPGMSGAVALAGEAALRSGAGLVTVAAHPDSIAAVVNRRPELMTVSLSDAGLLPSLIDRADVIALGPGLGQSEWSRAVFDAVVGTGKPLVLDADGLNLLAARPIQRDRWVITPHPGEASRLLNWSTSRVQANRSEAAGELVRKFNATVVLKGAASIVHSAGFDVPGVCTAGNPGMGSGGMGDVLTGVIVGLIAQTGNLDRSARVGVLAHAMAGDIAAREGQRGLIATDVLVALRHCLNPCR